MFIKNIVKNNGLKVLIPALLLSHSAVAEEKWWDEMDLYVGAGIGQSLLNFPTPTAGESISDNTGDAWKITAGIDLNDHISVEGYYADLGKAKLDPSNEYTFRMQGVDAILHYWVRGEERAEGSVALYAKAGLAYIDTHMSQSRDESTNAHVGLGAELYLPYDFSVRLEAESYYADASLFSINLIKRFGFRSKEAGTSLIEEPLDSDSDGISDDFDQCPNTPDNSEVNEVGCSIFVGEVGSSIGSEEFQFESKQLQFNLNSASLTASSKSILDKVASMLTAYKTMKIEVQAHSDSSGAAAYNKKLSQQRAESVVEYISSKNIDSNRLVPVGYGEAKPIASNNTVAGRAENRRVELILLEK